MASEARKTTLTTGSATGIGRAIVVSLARCGFDVAINFSRSEGETYKTVTLVEAKGAKTMLVQADASQEQNVIAMAPAEERIETFDALVLGNFGKVSKKDLVQIVTQRMGTET